jgi:hypothetical protein
MMLIRLDDRNHPFGDTDRYIAIINRRCDRSAFLKVAQTTPGSYAEELMGRIYDCLIPYAIDVKEEHQKYYSIEYTDFGAFLYWKYSLDTSVIADILNNLGEEDILVYGTVHSGGDYVTGQFIMSEAGFETINKTFDRSREANREDQG